MKQTYIFITTIVISCVFNTLGFSQIGIGTSTPNGMLEIKSTDYGLVYPIVSLTRTDTQTILNPLDGLEIVDGTSVYNVNTTSNGIYSVYEGLYVWDATNNKWTPQFSKKDYAIRSQNEDVRTASGVSLLSLGFDDNTFTPKYSGVYKISIQVPFGGGQLRNPNSSYHVNFAPAECEFTFEFNSNNYTFSVQSYSALNRDNAFVGSGTKIDYVNSYTQATYVLEETLIAGTTYTFSLGFLQATAPDFINNGEALTTGQGYIYQQGAIKYNVEFTYIDQ